MLWHVLISLAEDSHFSCALTVGVPGHHMGTKVAKRAGNKKEDTGVAHVSS